MIKRVDLRSGEGTEVGAGVYCRAGVVREWLRSLRGVGLMLGQRFSADGSASEWLDWRTMAAGKRAR